MRKMMIAGGLLALVLASACGRDDKGSGTPSSKSTEGASAAGLDVSLSPTGQADVYITDDKGKRIDASGATGRVELPDGKSVPLTPSDGGRLTAPLGEHARDRSHGCDATVRVTPRTGGERIARLDMCRGMGPGQQRGPGQMRPGDHGMEGGEMGHGEQGGGSGS